MSQYLYRGELVRVIDGDTVRFKLHRDADIGFYITHTITAELNLRFFGINAPEMHGESKAKGEESKKFVEDSIKSSKSIKIETMKPDKYGRWLANVYLMQDDEEYLLNAKLVELGFAVKYME